MRIFRLGLFAKTWEHIVDPEERYKKAEELKEARKRINKEHTKRIEPYSDEKIIEKAKSEYTKFENKKTGGKGTSSEKTGGAEKTKSLRDLENQAANRKNESLAIRNKEFEQIQDKAKPKPNPKPKPTTPEPQISKKEVGKIIKETLKKPKVKGSLIAVGGLGLASGAGYLGHKAWKKHKEKKDNEKVRRSIYNPKKKGS